MKYVLGTVERVTTSTGKNMIKAELLDENGTEAVEKGVALWDSFPNFADLKQADRVEGDLVVKQNGEYRNVSLYPIKTATGANSGRMGAMSKAMDKKADNIATAQGNKELGIKIASTMNGAINLAIAEKDTSPDNILKWRKWIWENWSAQDTDFAPFPSSSPDPEIEYNEM